MIEFKLNEKTAFTALWLCLAENKLGTTRAVMLMKIKSTFNHLADNPLLELELAHILNDWVDAGYVKRMKMNCNTDRRSLVSRCYIPGPSFGVFIERFESLIKQLSLSVVAKTPANHSSSEIL